MDDRYSVGAVVVTMDGQEFDGHTGETDPLNHAEEEAIAKAVAAGVDLKGATIYSSMEPCSTRASKPVSCSQLIIEHGFRRLVFGLREPDRFVNGTGAQMLSDAGIEILEIPMFGTEVARINAHICS
jgi:5-amino-6-(5-phosphoribosylamino)uracil reductase